MLECSFLAGPLDTGSSHSVVYEFNRFPTYNRFFTAAPPPSNSLKIFEESSLHLCNGWCHNLHKIQKCNKIYKLNKLYLTDEHNFLISHLNRASMKILVILV